MSASDWYVLIICVLAVGLLMLLSYNFGWSSGFDNCSHIWSDVFDQFLPDEEEEEK